EAVGGRSVAGARLERAPLALRARQLACVSQRDQLLGEPRQHQARIADDREQHLAQRFGLTRVQAERWRPVTGQSQSAQAQQCRGDLGRGPADDAGGLLGREGGPREQRSREQRVRALGAFGEGAQALRRDKRLARAAPQGGETVRYEGYGPGGAAVMVECVTDDRRQVGAKVRRAFVQHGGRLGADGSVSYLFNTVGLMTYPPGTDEERLMQVALEAGAEDVVPNADHSVEVLADPLEFDTVCA